MPTIMKTTQLPNPEKAASNGMTPVIYMASIANIAVTTRGISSTANSMMVAIKMTMAIVLASI